MRVIFSLYGINISIILILVTLISSCINNVRHPIWHQRILKGAFFYTYVVFGPVLVCLSIVGLSAYSESLLFLCDPVKGKDGDTDVHYQNLVQISIALGVSLSTTFVFTLFYVIYTFQIEILDERSMVARIYYKSLSVFGPWFSSRGPEEGEQVLAAPVNNYGGVN